MFADIWFWLFAVQSVLGIAGLIVALRESV